MRFRPFILLFGIAHLPIVAGADDPIVLREIQVTDEAGQEVPRSPDSSWGVMLQAYVGQPLDLKLRTKIADDILAWFSHHDQPMMSIEELDAANDVVSFKMVSGRIHHVFIAGGGRHLREISAPRWAVREGEPLHISVLEDELSWIHRNPLHIGMLNLSEVATDDATPWADLRLDLDQSRTLRAGLAYRNDGIAPLSDHRFTTSIEAADLLGIPAWWNIQATTAEDVASYQQYRVASRFFLPWQHEFSGSVSWVRVSAPTDAFAGLIDAIDAESLAASLRYIVPVKLSSDWKLDLGMGADFRRTNNTLEFGSLTLAGDADSSALATDITFRRQTMLRDTGLNLSANYSPGGITANDDDAHHSALRQGAEAQHLILRGSAWRRRESTRGWTMIGQVSGQWANQPTLPQDQLMLASTSTVRGYDEASVLSDRGLWGSVEVRSPAWSFHQSALQIQPLTFVDAGLGWDEVINEQSNVASLGFGLRVSFWKNLSASCAYAWRLTETGGRLHLAITATF